jgi:glycosyltransferase involved in cell wall biosynthesis
MENKTQIEDSSTGPKVAVIICHYNHNQYLKQSIQSIVNQSYENLDIIIVDDGSDNPPDDIVTLFDDERIIYKKLNKNCGKWFCLNYAIGLTDATIITSHDADDVSLINRIDRQLKTMLGTKTFHNLCGFHHCYNQDDIEKYVGEDQINNDQLRVLDAEWVSAAVHHGFENPAINHYFTGNFETAGVSAMFFKEIWTKGIRFNPPNIGLRVLMSEDSDFNFRVTTMLQKTSICAEQLYCYRRHTSTNKEEK